MNASEAPLQGLSAFETSSELTVAPAAHAPARRREWGDLLSRVGIGVLFLLLSKNLLADFLKTQHLTGLLLLASEFLVVVLTIVRRSTDIVDRSVLAGVATVISMAGPPLLRATDGAGLVPDAASACVSAAGLCLVIAGKVTLGRSFGIVPANRGVVASGAYMFVRHPIYAGYLVTHLAFVLAHPRPWNIAVLIAGDSALIVRALIEERLLSRDPGYQAYCRSVGWHLVPGVF